MSEQHKVPIVIDNGSYLMKVGLAGEDTPRSIFPTIIGYKLGQNTPYFWEKSQDQKDYLDIIHPIEHGIISDWGEMEKIWEYTFDKVLRIDPKEQGVLLTEAYLNPIHHREKMAEIMFETFNVPALYFALPSVLSLYAAGRGMGVILDSGSATTTIVPINYAEIIDGVIIPNLITNAIVTSDIAGQDVMQLEEAKRADAYFNPQLIGSSSEGIHMKVYESIMKCDPKLHRDYFNNVILSGGGTKFEGFAERLKKELQVLAPNYQIGVVAGHEREYWAWIGGSIEASLKAWKKMCIYKKEYQKNGPSIIQKKCPHPYP